MLETDQFEGLRLILEREQGRTVRYGEAKEVGVALLDLYEALAEDGATSGQEE